MPTATMAKPPANFSATPRARSQRSGTQRSPAAPRSRAAITAGLFMFLFVAGWGVKWLLAGRVPPRVDIAGIATLDGKPLAKGFVQFVPLARTVGRKLGTEVTGGAFSLKGENGLPPGSYRVEFRTFIDEHASPHGNAAAEKTISHGPNIPLHYSEKSPFEVSVSADTTKLEFALRTKTAP